MYAPPAKQHLFFPSEPPDPTLPNALHRRARPVNGLGRTSATARACLWRSLTFWATVSAYAHAMMMCSFGPMTTAWQRCRISPHLAPTRCLKAKCCLLAGTTTRLRSNICALQPRTSASSLPVARRCVACPRRLQRWLMLCVCAHRQGKGRIDYLCFVFHVRVLFGAVPSRYVPVSYNMLNATDKTEWARACHLLGVAYETGRGVGKNTLGAEHLYNLAAEQDYAASLYRRGLIWYRKSQVLHKIPLLLRTIYSKQDGGDAVKLVSMAYGTAFPASAFLAVSPFFFSTPRSILGAVLLGKGRAAQMCPNRVGLFLLFGVVSPLQLR